MTKIEEKIKLLVCVIIPSLQARVLNFELGQAIHLACHLRYKTPI